MATTDREKLIKLIEEAKLSDKTLGDVLDTLYRLSQGIFYEKTGIDGSVRVYKELPDRQAGQYLADRILGKITDSMRIVDKNNNDLLSVVDLDIRIKNATGKK